MVVRHSIRRATAGLAALRGSQSSFHLSLGNPRSSGADTPRTERYWRPLKPEIWGSANKAGGEQLLMSRFTLLTHSERSEKAVTEPRGEKKEEKTALPFSPSQTAKRLL